VKPATGGVPWFEATFLKGQACAHHAARAIVSHVRDAMAGAVWMGNGNCRAGGDLNSTQPDCNSVCYEYDGPQTSLPPIAHLAPTAS
jgi:hypothetical protein